MGSTAAKPLWVSSFSRKRFSAKAPTSACLKKPMLPWLLRVLHTSRRVEEACPNAADLAPSGPSPLEAKSRQDKKRRGSNSLFIYTKYKPIIENTKDVIAI